MKPMHFMQRLHIQPRHSRAGPRLPSLFAV